MAWTVADVPSQDGKIAVITGGTGGLGLETALVLAKAGADVVLTGRNDTKGQAALEKLRAAVPGAKVRYETLDLANLASVAEFARRFAETDDTIDLLINNAGVMALPSRQTTADGFEMQFGTNYLGHYALTGRLLPRLRAGNARVVNLSSLAHRTGFIQFGDLQGERLYSAWKAYNQSKLAMLMFALELQRRSAAAGWNLTSVAAHPGWARTELFANGPGNAGLFGFATQFAAPFLSQSASDGALPILYAATSPQAKPGGYYGPSGLSELRGPPAGAMVMPQARDAGTAARLWDESAKLTGVSFA
jgi:NAD(P)-dependent dehydrogenase (short-subunit alcohol dehydrogenase family)